MEKLNNPNRIDILNVEIDSISFDDEQIVNVSSSFYSLGKAHRVKVEMKVDDEEKMASSFLDYILQRFKEIDSKDKEITDTGYIIANKMRLESDLKNFFLKVKIGSEKAKADEFNSFDYAMITTNRLDFYNPEFSLDNKSLQEKVNILLKKAQGDIHEGYYIPAKDLLKKILILDVDNKMAYALLGACHRELEELEEAEKAFKRWLDLSEPDEDKPYFNYGDILFRLEKYDEAEKVYEAYLKIFPNDFNGIMELAQIRYLQDKNFISPLKDANRVDSKLLKKELLGNFIYSKPEDYGEPMDTKLAAAFLSVEPEYIRNLVKEDKIPYRILDDEPVLYEKELEAWAEVMNKFKVLETQFKIDTTAVDKLKAMRKALPDLIKEQARARSRERQSRRQKKKKILEDLGQQTLFEKEE